MYAFLMDNTGLRPGEAVALNRSDINLKNYHKSHKDISRKTKTNSECPKDRIKSENRANPERRNKADCVFRRIRTAIPEASGQ